MIKKTLLCFICLSLFLSVSTCKKKTPTEPIIPELILPTIEYFGASPGSIKLGSYSTLSWATFNATSVSISRGIGTVSATGTTDVYPSETTSYTLTARNSDGSKSSSCWVLILEWAELTLSLDPPAPIVYFWADGSSTSNFTVTATESNGVGGRIDMIRIIGTPPSGPTWAQAIASGKTFSPYGSVSQYCSMLLYCYPQHVLVKAEGEDMHGYMIDVGISFFLLWTPTQDRATMSFSGIVYGPNHHKRIK